MVIPGGVRASQSASSAPDSPEQERLRTIPARFAAAVRRFESRVAIEDQGEVLTYRDLDLRSNQLARAILEKDPAAGQPVIIHIGQSASFIVAALAALKAGKAYVPLEPSDTVEERRAIAMDVAPRLILCDTASMATAHALCQDGTAILGVDTASRFRSDAVSVDILSDQIASIYFTSGTTGTPKGVVDLHRTIIHNAERYSVSLAIAETDRHSLIQSPSFSGTSSTMFSCLLAGASVFPFDLRRHGMAQLVAWMNRNRITIWHSVPFLFEQALNQGLDARTIRLIRMEGDQLHYRHVQLFQTHCGRDAILVNGLGTTETGLVRQFFVTQSSPQGRGVVPLGYAVPGMDVKIRRPDGTLAATGEVGEIEVCSSYMAQGYWKRPDLTAAKFHADPDDPQSRCYRTGDLGLLRPDGCLESLGRKAFQAKIKGRMVDFSVVEHAVSQVPGVKQVLVGIDEKTTATQQLVAYVVADVPISITRFRSSLSDSLPTWLFPSHYVFVDALPSDRHGKLIRSGLLPRPTGRPNLEAAFQAPRTAMERLVAECFSEVLKVEPVGRHDDFFELGGDSLLAAAVALDIERRIERVIFPDAVFDNPTVSALAARLARQSETPAVYALTDRQEGTPLFCVNVQPDQPSGFRTLAHLLDHQPVFVLPISRPSVDVADMARQCIAAMRDVQPEGPYQICGNCFAGVVAFEMAQQLRADQEVVSMLGLIDTAFPPRQPNMAARASVYRRSWRHLLSRGQFKARLARAAVRLGLSRTHAWLDLYQTLRIAELQYKPQPYEGPTRLFIAGALGNQAGWQNVIPDGLEIVQIADVRWENDDDRPHLIAEPLVHHLALALSGKSVQTGASIQGADADPSVS